MKRCYFPLLMLLAVIAWTPVLQAQTSAKSTEPSGPRLDFEQFDIRNLLGKGFVSPTVPVIPLEQAIDPSKYVVGPSDVFSVNVWIAMGYSFQASVTPEGSLIIPTVGEIKVAGLMLAEAKQMIGDRVRAKYSGGDITITLISPRTFIVYVTGLVFREGPQIVPATTRVDRVVVQANATPDTSLVMEKKEAFRKRVLQYIRENASTRNILVRRKDGSTVRADLTMYYGTGDDSYNPYLVDGDIVFVPRKHTEENFLRLLGAVTLPGPYEFVPGDRLLDAIALAHGLSPLADSSFVELIRINATSTASTSTRIDLREVVAGRQSNILLERGDRMVVRQQVVLDRDYTVSVDGEVRYAGVYPITKSTTKLSDVIKMAGGFTEHAFIKGGVVIRPGEVYDVGEIGTAFERTLAVRPQHWEPWDTTYYFLDARVKRRLVSVDFGRVFNDHDPSSDVALYDGDFIYVPSLKRMVYMYGQVNYPGYVPWVEGMKAGYYIREAGGYTDNANEGDTRVVKAKTLQWMKPGSTEIEVGDRIFVPSKERRRVQWYVLTISQGAAIVGAILGSIALILQINK